MGFIAAVRGSFAAFRSKTSTNPYQIIAAASLSILIPCCLPAQNATRDTSAQSMQNVKDVTGGVKYLLQADDVAFFQLSNGPGGSVATALNFAETSNSKFSAPSGEVINETIASGHWNVTSYSNSVAVGRFFAIPTDDMGVLAPVNGPAWNWFMEGPITNFTGDFNLNSRFAPYGGVYTQVVTGNFLGNRLAVPLLFYLSQGPSQTEWAMRVLTPPNPNVEQSLTQGPEFYSLNAPGVAVPTTGSIVAGDFNGDGKDEVALLNGGQTIDFYSVDPDTLTISQTGSLSLPQSFTNGTATLAAGRFRDTQNVELVAVGTVTYPDTTIYSIQITPNSNNTGFTPSLAKTNVLPGISDLYGVTATAASLTTPLVPINQQLVFGEKNATYIVIGSFGADFTFNQQSFSNLFNKLSPTTRLLSLRAGNFDNQNPYGTHNPATQIATYTTDSSNQTAVLSLFTIAPQSADWLQLAAQSATQSANGLLAADAVIGDLQGRSLLLGSPEIVTIPQQIQPDIVLGLPPQHIDWVKPVVPFTNTSRHPGCNTTSAPCVLNLTVMPSVPAPSTGFQTGFSFTSSTDSSSSRKSTTSWGVSVKNTATLKVSWGTAFDGGSLKVSNATGYAHDHVVAQTYNTFQGTKESISATTGFADHVFYTEKDMNIYYYPIIGQSACPTGDPSCSQKQQEYVEFSVPDQVTHFDLDGTTLEWYQPVHEAGNVLSYPWNFTLLQQQFANTAPALSENPAPVQGTDSSQTLYTTTWSNGSGQGKSSGSTNSFSDDFSFSASSRAGVADVLTGKFTDQVDVGGSGSLSSLNENTASISASSGVAVNKPAFDSEVASCCLYNFGSYIFGQQNATNRALQTINVLDPGGAPAALQSTGPLFVGFTADLVPNGINGVSNFFPQAYSLPDVAVNHPARWSWSKSTETATFNAANQSVSLLDDPFYWMKGFFITKTGESGTAPNLREATAGDQLSLSARVYNYSLVDTNSASLAHPAASIHVRFYGQFVCHSGVSTENSCVGTNNTTCAAYTLCGNSFRIGETQVASIPGFDSASNQGTQPNWVATQPINFDTTAYANTYLAFWVVTWMEDASGNLIPEMPGHGLTADPAGMTFAQISQVPAESYSNNVGMYGVNSPFFIFPAASSSAALGAAAPSTAAGELKSIRVETSKELTLEQPAKVVVHLRAENAAVNAVTLAYYDGNPRSDGKLFDVQRIAHIDPGTAITHRAFFQPKSCGPHKLFARAWAGGSRDLLGEFTASVSVDPVDATSALLASTNATNMSAHLRSFLQSWLISALQSFEYHRTGSGMDSLTLYVRRLKLTKEKEIRTDLAQSLIGQAEATLGCLPQPSSSR